MALTPGAALAHGKTKVYKATFQFVGADSDYASGNYGKAQLVDGKRNDKLSVHVRGLPGKSQFVFRLLQAPKACAADAPAGADVTGWKYRHGGVLKTNRNGGANSKATSRTFSAKRDVEYFVGVYTAASGGKGTPVLCAKLTTNRHKPQPNQPKPKPTAPKPKPDDKPNGKSDDAPGHNEDKPRGKSDDAPGHDKDKSRGKSEDAPGHNKKPRA